MAKITYLPEAGTPARATQFGVEFGPEPVEVTDPRIIAKCKGSPFYAVDDAVAPAAAVGKEPSKEGYRAVHNGGGRFIIVFGDKDEKVVSGLDKEAAHAFNELHDDAKAVRVAELAGAAA